MNLLFDTNIIIAFLKNEKPVVDLFQEQKYINISSVTVGEMLYGALNSKKSKENIKLYKDFFGYCNIYKIDEKTSEYYAKIKLHLKTTGNPIPENDIWISATALENNFRIVTRDKHILSLELIKAVSI